MRPIDADKLLQYWGPPGAGGPDFPQGDICDSINAQPTLDVAPVVHADWVRVRGTRSGWRCSKCWFRPKKRTDDPGTLPNYCERCGAKMDLTIKG